MGYVAEESDNFLIIIILLHKFIIMKNLHSVLADLLSCGYRDLQFLDELIGAYYIDIDIEELNHCYGKTNNINILIYDAYRQIKDIFLDENEFVIKYMGLNPNGFEEGEDYEIFTNYIDSHLYFTNNKVNDWYEKWRKH